MNKKTVIVIMLISIAAAVGGITMGVKATHEKNAALNQVEMLRNALDASGGIPTVSSNAPEEATPLVLLEDIPAVNTNDASVLLQQLAERNAELKRLQAELERRSNREPRLSFQERMAQLKEEDPERYAEMIQQRTERQEQMRYDQASRLALFTDVDTNGMSPEELANHNQLLERLTALWAATEAFDPENPPDWRVIRESVGDFREIGRMMDQERSYMLKQLGAEVGLSGADARDFAAYVEDIVGATSLRMPRGTRGGRGN